MFWGRSYHNWLPPELVRPKAPTDILGENFVRRIALSFLMGSLSNLQVTKMVIKSRTSLISSHFGLLAL